MVRKWTDTCSSAHGDHFQRPPLFGEGRQPGDHPLRLIDVQRKCIKPATPDDKYVTLGYGWGQNKRESLLESRQDNIARMKEEGSLASEEFLTILSETLRDAIDSQSSTGSSTHG
jgi:hypothetical protein